MELFEAQLIDLDPGDQFESDGGYGHRYYEVFSNNGSTVRFFPTDLPLFRPDGTPIRNMVYSYTYNSPGMKVIRVVNKRPVHNRNHEVLGDSKTWLFPNRQQEAFQKN